jgi:hypothetical protein
MAMRSAFPSSTERGASLGGRSASKAFVAAIKCRSSRALLRRRDEPQRMNAAVVRNRGVIPRAGWPQSPEGRVSSSPRSPYSRARGVATGSRIRSPIQMPTPTGYGQRRGELRVDRAMTLTARCVAPVRTPVRHDADSPSLGDRSVKRVSQTPSMRYTSPSRPRAARSAVERSWARNLEWIGVLEDKVTCSGFGSVDNAGTAGMRGEHDHRGCGMLRDDPSGGFDAIDPRHRDVHEHHVGLVPVDKLQRFRTACLDASRAHWSCDGRWLRTSPHRETSNPGAYSHATTSIPTGHQRNSTDDTFHTSFSHWLTTSRVALATCSCDRCRCVWSVVHPRRIVCRGPDDHFRDTDFPGIRPVRSKRRHRLHACVRAGHAPPLHRPVPVCMATRRSDRGELCTCRFRSVSDARRRHERDAGVRQWRSALLLLG